MFREEELLEWLYEEEQETENIYRKALALGEDIFGRSEER